MRAIRSVLLPSSLAIVALVAACSSDDGAPSSSSGGSSTSSSSSSSGGATDAGEDATADGGGAKKGLTEACATDAECESNTCFKGNQGSYCSLACTAASAATVCVSPFNGVCNNQGFCRKP